MKQLNNWDEALQWMNDNPKRPELIRLKELEAKVEIDSQVISQTKAQVTSLQSTLSEKDKLISDLMSRIDSLNTKIDFLDKLNIEKDNTIRLKDSLLISLETISKDKNILLENKESEITKLTSDLDVINKKLVKYEYQLDQYAINVLIQEDTTIIGNDGYIY